MFKRLALIFVLWLGGFASPSFSPSRAQETSNPYIYYFWDALNAFIIERADGTDTRVLADGLMALTGDAQSIHVEGPGWSPSGKWFAWTAAQVSNNGYGWSGHRPYILSADGTEWLTLLDHLQAAQLAWAANEDVLFVASIQTEPLNPGDPGDYHSVVDTYLAMIDVENKVVLSSFEDRTLSDYFLYQETMRLAVIRTNDGEHFVARYVDFEGGDNYHGTAVVVVFDTNGTITEKRLDAYGLVSMDFDNTPFPSVSRAGWVAYPTEDSFRVDNVLTGEQLVFAPLDDSRQIQWDTSGWYAVISDGNLWLLDCETGTLTQLRADWEFSSIVEPFDDRPLWSPNGHYAMMLGADGLLYTFNRNTSTLTELAFPAETERGFPDVGWYWLDTEHLVIYSAAEPGMFIYDLSSLADQHIDIELPSYTRPRLSPDNKLIAFVHDEAVIYNRETMHELRVRPAYGSLGTFPGGEVEWHDSGEWLFIFKDAIRAGGPVIRHLGIVRADGTMRRDLSYSWYPNSITLNWLPPQVDPADLPPPIEKPLIPQPETVLHGSHWSFYAGWSPDGRKIAAGLGWDSGGDITVWKVGTDEIVYVFENAGEDERVLWPQGEEFVPELGSVSGDENILARSPDGRQSVQNGIQDGIWGTQVIDANTGSVLTELQGQWNSTFVSADYSPDGCLLVAAYPYLPVRIWDTATWEIVATLPNPGQASAFSPDGTQLAVTASWDVQIWDVATLLGSDVQ